MIYTPLGRIEHQKFFTIKRWSEFQYVCLKCGKKGEVIKINDIDHDLYCKDYQFAMVYRPKGRSVEHGFFTFKQTSTYDHACVKCKSVDEIINCDSKSNKGIMINLGFIRITFSIRNRIHKSISISNKKHQWIIKFNPFCVHKYSAS